MKVKVANEKISVNLKQNTTMAIKNEFLYDCPTFVVNEKEFTRKLKTTRKSIV